ncbi:palindromic element RPE3 domain-containing protein [Rickettsia hoogstraalii]|nr:palindromic element RPE3 domain-containing protein [Rickettsia hoogstraalii]
MDDKKDNNISEEENLQLNSQSFRQDEFKSKSTERTIT